MLRGSNLYQTLMYAGGVVTSGYVASQLSGWLGRHLVPTTSSTFLWIQQNVSDQSSSVLAKLSMLPPEPVWTGANHSVWIAAHLVRVMSFCLITAAVLAVFVIGDYLSTALWDAPRPPAGRLGKCFAAGLTAACSLYLCAVTSVLTANLAWLDRFHILSKAITQSLVVQGIARCVASFHTWGFH